MRGNGCVVIIGLAVAGLFAAACLVLSLSFRPVATQGLGLVATAQAEPPTVAERASDIREQTRLDNGNQGVPFVVWFFGGASVVGVVLLQLDKLMTTFAGIQKAWGRWQKKRKPAPALRIENPNLPRLPQVPTRPQTPESWTRPQLPPGGEEW